MGILRNNFEPATKSLKYVPKQNEAVIKLQADNYDGFPFYNFQTQIERYSENELEYQSPRTSVMIRKRPISFENDPHILSSKFEQKIDDNNPQVANKKDNRHNKVKEPNENTHSYTQNKQKCCTQPLKYDTNKITNLAKNQYNSQGFGEVKHGGKAQINSSVSASNNVSSTTHDNNLSKDYVPKIAISKETSARFSSAQIKTEVATFPNGKMLSSPTKLTPNQNYENARKIGFRRVIGKQQIVPLQMFNLTEVEYQKVIKKVDNYFNKSNVKYTSDAYYSTKEPKYQERVVRTKRQIFPTQEQARASKNKQEETGNLKSSSKTATSRQGDEETIGG